MNNCLGREKYIKEFTVEEYQKNNHLISDFFSPHSHFLWHGGGNMGEQWYNEEIYYTPIDIRLENIESNKRFYSDLVSISNQERIIIFTHEWSMDNKKVKKYMKWFAEYGNKIGKSFSFPEDRIEK